jgi:hypothetical protein
MVGQQAGAKFAVCRQAKPIAVVAEMMAQGTDQSYFSLCACDAEAPGRTVDVATIYRNQLPMVAIFSLISGVRI